ncbi:hypothetical protein IAU59_000860 [Kwoniella sp. CBS 9459]
MSTSASTKEKAADLDPSPVTGSKKEDSTTASGPNKKEILYHRFHNDHRDQVIILSNDKVKFRASRTRLIDASLFFSDLLGTPGHIGKTNEPIALDFPAEIVSLFRDMASVCQPHAPIRGGQIPPYAPRIHLMRPLDRLRSDIPHERCQ